jgi:hypothetical protein
MHAHRSDRLVPRHRASRRNDGARSASPEDDQVSVCHREDPSVDSGSRSSARRARCPHCRRPSFVGACVNKPNQAVTQRDRDEDRRDRFRDEDERLCGTFAPDRRASDRPIAIACFRLVTFFPERPLRSVPRLRSCIARLTLPPALLPYFAMSVSLSDCSACARCVERLARGVATK